MLDWLTRCVSRHRSSYVSVSLGLWLSDRGWQQLHRELQVASHWTGADLSLGEPRVIQHLGVGVAILRIEPDHPFSSPPDAVLQDSQRPWLDPWRYFCDRPPAADGDLDLWNAIRVAIDYLETHATRVTATEVANSIAHDHPLDGTVCGILKAAGWRAPYRSVTEAQLVSDYASMAGREAAEGHRARFIRDREAALTRIMAGELVFAGDLADGLVCHGCGGTAREHMDRGMDRACRVCGGYGRVPR